MNTQYLVRDAIAGVTVAIMALPLALGFGITSGMSATGAIARTSVNVRAHAHSKYASVFHAIVLLIVALAARPFGISNS